MEKLLIDLLKSLGLMDLDSTNFKITDSPSEEGDKSLGDMNELEIRCKMFLENKKPEHEQFHDQMAEMDESSEPYRKLMHQHNTLHHAEKMVRNIMWTSVASRFEPMAGTSGYALRNDNKVVARFQNEHTHRSPFPFSGMGITVIEIGTMKW